MARPDPLIANDPAPVKSREERIAAAERELRACTKDTLESMVRARYRVVDLRGATKRDLVAMLLESQFGRGK